MDIIKSAVFTMDVEKLSLEKINALYEQVEFVILFLVLAILDFLFLDANGSVQRQKNSK